MMVLLLAHMHILSILAGSTPPAAGPSGDPGTWGVNLLNWVITKGGLLVTLGCTVLLIVGVVTFVSGNIRKGLERIGTGLAGILLGVWVTSGAAATFIQSFQH